MSRKTLMIHANAAARRVAKSALERRKKLPKSKRGGLGPLEAHEEGVGSGVMRASDIAKGNRVNAYQVKAFFDRHRHNYVKARAEGKAWEDSKILQSWDLWGGEPMRKQVETAVKKDKKKRARQKNPPAPPEEKDHPNPECQPLEVSDRIKRVRLVDAAKLAREHPKTFKRPTTAKLRKVKPGAFVKVNVGGERIWLRVTGYEKRRYHGAVANLPDDPRLDLGTRVYFQKRNIYSVRT